MTDSEVDAPLAFRELQERRPELTPSQAVRQMLERDIVSGDMAPGDRINENAIASRLQVNRAMVREALVALAEDGLVGFVRNRGAYVRRIGLEDALQLYEVRAGLARSAGRLLAMRASARDLRALDAIQAELVRAADGEDVGEYDRLNIAFHEALIAGAHNPQLVRFEHKVGRDIRLYLRRGVAAPHSLRISSREHQTILDAVRASDPEAAGAAFELHVLNGRQRMLEAATLRPGMAGDD
jgi:DNA-binding GntR family transcriptional regulator